MNRLLIPLLLFIFHLNANAQAIDREKLDQFFDRIEEANQGMGSISITNSEGDSYQRAIGFSDVEENIKATPETHYRIGSITKTFTASLILQLVEKEKLSLKDKLSDYYPQIENADEITIAHLLNHRSGIYDYTSSPAFAKRMGKPISKEALLDSIKAGDSKYEPNTFFDYSNSNYVLLTWIIEQVSGNSYDTLIQSNICEPCQLSETYVGGRQGSRPDEARSYRRSDPWEYVPEWDMSVALGAGNIVSTASDVNRFYRCLLDSDKLIKEESRDMMLSMEDGYGYGIFEVPFYDQKGYGHNGGIEGFSSVAYYFPEMGVGIAYISNAEVYLNNNIVVGALSLFLGKDYALPEFAPEIDVDVEILDTYLGVYVADDFPLDIEIYRSGSKLFAEATGQGSIYLTPISETEFTYDAAGLKLTFLPDSAMKLEQMGNEVLFDKKEK